MTAFDEQDVIQRLRALAQDTVVTDQEVVDAQVRFRAHRSRPQRRGPVVLVAAVAAAVAVVALLVLATLPGPRTADRPGPEPGSPTRPLDPDALLLPEDEFLAGTTPTAAQLEGLWHLRTDDEARVLMLGSDGRLLGTDSELGRADDASLLDAPADSGTYAMQGDSLVVTISRVGCPAPTTVTNRAALMPDDSLHLVMTADTSTSPEARCRALPRAVWDRVSPGRTAFLANLRPNGRWSHQTAPWTLIDPGLYVSHDGSWVLLVDSDRGYRAFRGGDLAVAPADAGRILREDRGRGTLRLSCRGGQLSADVRISPGFSIHGVTPPQKWFSGTLDASDCASGLGDVVPWEWVRIMPEALPEAG